MEAENEARRSLNYKIAMTGAFAALSVILSVTPLGYIQLGGAIQITLMHIPTILAALLGGLESGVVVGFVFGLSSLLHGLMTPTAASPFFLNPLVSILPRMIFPVALWAIYTALCLIPHLPKTIAATVAAAVGTFIHTLLVMGAICVFYADTYLPMVRGAIEKLFGHEGVSGFKAYCAVIAITMITNGFLEIAVAAFFVAAVFLALFAKNHGKSKVSRFADTQPKDESLDF